VHGQYDHTGRHDTIGQKGGPLLDCQSCARPISKVVLIFYIYFFFWYEL
jgi:hypothetical protein